MFNKSFTGKEFQGPMPDFNLDEPQCTQRGLTQRPSVILVVTRHGHLSEQMMDYALEVAERLQSAVLVAYVDTMPFWDGVRRTGLFNSAVAASVMAFKKRAGARGVVVSHVRESGKICRVVHRLCRLVRKISFVVVDEGIRIEEASKGAPVPVFSVSGEGGSSSRGLHKRRCISTEFEAREEVSKKSARHYRKMFGHAVSAIALYWLFFLYSGEIVQSWSRGGGYAVLPVLTVCVFYFVQQLVLDDLFTLLSSRSPQKEAVLPIRGRAGQELRATRELT